MNCSKCGSRFHEGNQCHGPSYLFIVLLSSIPNALWLACFFGAWDYVADRLKLPYWGYKLGWCSIPSLGVILSIFYLEYLCRWGALLPNVWRLIAGKSIDEPPNWQI